MKLTISFLSCVIFFSFFYQDSESLAPSIPGVPKNSIRDKGTARIKDKVRDVLRKGRDRDFRYKKLREKKRPLKEPPGGFKLPDRPGQEGCRATATSGTLVKYCTKAGRILISKKSADTAKSVVSLRLLELGPLRANGEKSPFYMSTSDVENRLVMQYDAEQNDDSFNISSKSIKGSTSIYEDGEIGLEFYIFHDDGSYAFDDEYNFVLPGDLKTNLLIKKNISQVDPEATLFEVVFEVSPPKRTKDKGRPKRIKSIGEKIREDSQDSSVADIKSPERFALGDDDETTGIFSVSKKYLLDGIFKQMPEGYPKVTVEDDGRRLFKVAFEPWQELLVYDPTLEAPLTPEEYEMLNEDPPGDASCIQSASLLLMVSLVSTLLAY